MTNVATASSWDEADKKGLNTRAWAGWRFLLPLICNIAFGLFGNALSTTTYPTYCNFFLHFAVRLLASVL